MKTLSKLTYVMVLVLPALLYSIASSFYDGQAITTNARVWVRMKEPVITNQSMIMNVAADSILNVWKGKFIGMPIDHQLAQLYKKK